MGFVTSGNQGAERSKRPNHKLKIALETRVLTEIHEDTRPSMRVAPRSEENADLADKHLKGCRTKNMVLNESATDISIVCAAPATCWLCGSPLEKHQRPTELGGSVISYWVCPVCDGGDPLSTVASAE
jgi:hypothetical protein